MGTGLNLLSQSAQEDATARVLEELVGVGVADCRVAYFGSG